MNSWPHVEEYIAPAHLVFWQRINRKWYTGSLHWNKNLLWPSVCYMASLRPRTSEARFSFSDRRVSLISPKGKPKDILVRKAVQYSALNHQKVSSPPRRIVGGLSDYILLECAVKPVPRNWKTWHRLAVQRRLSTMCDPLKRNVLARGDNR